MLTLGLMEGVLSATLGILVLMILANENAPLHRIFGPPITLIVGFTAYMIHDSGMVKGSGDVVGLAGFAVLVFFAPIGFMRVAWKSVKAIDAQKAAQVARPQPASAIQATAPERRAA